MESTDEHIVIVDFGSQYTQLIARRIRELQVHAIILPASAPLVDIQSYNPKGLIFSGGLQRGQKLKPPNGVKLSCNKAFPF